MKTIITRSHITILSRPIKEHKKPQLCHPFLFLTRFLYIFFDILSFLVSPGVYNSKLTWSKELQTDLELTTPYLPGVNNSKLTCFLQLLTYL